MLINYNLKEFYIILVKFSRCFSSSLKCFLIFKFYKKQIKGNSTI